MAEKTPYKETRRVRKFLVPRAQKKLKKRRVTRFRLIYTLTALILALIVFVGIQTRYHVFIPAQKASSKASSSQPKISSVLIIGSTKGENESREQSDGLLVMAYDENNKQISAISIPENTMVSIPGYDFDKIGDALYLGVPTVMSTVKNLLGVKIDHFIKVDSPAVAAVLKDTRFEKVFQSSKQSDISPLQRREWIKKLKALEDKDTNIISLPVHSVTIATVTYFQPRQDEIDRMISLIWGIPRSKRKLVRIEVFNGCGVPGVAGEVTQKLIENGFRATDGGNERNTDGTSNFSVGTTKIFIYQGDQALGEKLKSLLGVGEVSYKPVSQRLVDVKIVIGKDFKSNAAVKGKED